LSDTRVAEIQEPNFRFVRQPANQQRRAARVDERRVVDGEVGTVGIELDHAGRPIDRLPRVRMLQQIRPERHGDPLRTQRPQYVSESRRAVAHDERREVQLQAHRLELRRARFQSRQPLLDLRVDAVSDRDAVLPVDVPEEEEQVLAVECDLGAGSCSAR
jgi:hypothetical protein